MKLALIQTKQNELYHFTDTVRRFTLEEILRLQDQMMEQNLRLIERAAKNGADLILTSEAINYAGQPEKYDGDYIDVIRDTQERHQQRIRELSVWYGCYIAAGMYRVDEKDDLRNSMLVWNTAGICLEIYDKIHLTSDEQKYLIPGKKYEVLETPFGKLGICICWDMQFPECARILTCMGADLILCPTWGWESIYGHARAYENGVYVAAAMSVPFWMDIEGIRNPSEVVAPDGTVLCAGNREAEDIVICEFTPADCAPYRKIRMEGRRVDTYCGLLDEQ